MIMSSGFPSLYVHGPLIPLELRLKKTLKHYVQSIIIIILFAKYMRLNLNFFDMDRRTGSRALSTYPAALNFIVLSSYGKILVSILLLVITNNNKNIYIIITTFTIDCSSGQDMISSDDQYTIWFAPHNYHRPHTCMCVPTLAHTIYLCRDRTLCFWMAYYDGCPTIQIFRRILSKKNIYNEYDRYYYETRNMWNQSIFNEHVIIKKIGFNFFF